MQTFFNFTYGEFHRGKVPPKEALICAQFFVLRSWVGMHMHTDIFGAQENITADTFNQLMFTPEFVSALSNVSFLRGGGSPVGSMIWSDIDDFQVSTPIAPDTIQICGHSRVDHEPKVIGNVYCLDCGRTFMLNEIVNDDSNN